MSDGLIVQKYGGTSLGSPLRIRKVAEKIAARTRDDTRIIVTVSAMGGTTDRLVRLAHQITPHPSRRELDMLLTVGERVSMALLSMALNSMGCRAISFTGSQSGIVTNTGHTMALIEEIHAGRIEEALSVGHVVIVAGFQGVSRAKEITTLGRGGSDTTAVALAARLGASRCEIFSDVPGVFTADPRIVRGARLLSRIDYDSMLELAVLGAKVLHYRAAELARRYRVPLHLLSSFDDPGSTVVGSEDGVEHESITSITSRGNVALVRIASEGGGRVLSALLDRLVEREIRFVFYHRSSEETRDNLVLVLEAEDLEAARTAIGESHKGELTVDVSEPLASVSVVGTGFSSSSRAIARIEQVLCDAHVPVRYVGTTSLSVTCLVAATAREKTVDSLHAALVDAGRIRSGSA